MVRSDFPYSQACASSFFHTGIVMLRSFLKLIKSNDPIDPSGPHSLSFADTAPAHSDDASNGQTASHPAADQPMIAGKIGEGGVVRNANGQGSTASDCSLTESTVPPANHRAWLLSKRLSHIKICSPSRCEKLAKFGIITAGDLAKVDAEQLVAQMQVPPSAVRSLKRYRAAIRLSASIPGMMPRDAQLLIRIHRHSIRAIALDSPAELYRDLQRYAHSSNGQRLVGDRRLPSLRKVKAWVHTCRNQNDDPQNMRAAA